MSTLDYVIMFTYQWLHISGYIFSPVLKFVSLFITIKL